ncbi:aminoacetone oxidase family FAD-binding enzyme [Butyrivibrio sp. FCS006]|uniref:aminoacetone oxidase family FAD-binding enzyme n=1 Tax=Butyrivibrio sp. FCS006 TaxID=1280684 RepID=UPI000406F332|nr:aminoacetone oxidase family FAD-binding enzyme [Butyrivibrio sp. FCS006]
MGKSIIVAGGGAAGMCAAIYAARNGASVTIIEKNSVLGKKLSMTGNGRCNLTNLDMREECFNPSARARMKEWLSTYGVEDVISFFKSMGVVVKSEEGYIYPVSGQAMSVVNALLNEINRLGITVNLGEQVKGVKCLEGGKVLLNTNKAEYEADAVILSMGALSGAKGTMSTGDGYYICKNIGMTVKDTHPALVGFKVAEGEIMPSAGVRATAEVSFILGGEVLASEHGEVQLSSDGISGIPVMQASREVIRFVEEKKPVYAVLDFFPDYDESDFNALKADMLRLKDERTLEEFLQGFANSGITDMVLGRMKLGRKMKMKNISVSMAECILDTYRNVKIAIDSSYGYQASQVTTGGISLGDIGSDFSCKTAPGIYCVGELLDVDGRCGGYNLQFAWTSGCIAGCAASL